MLNLNVAAGTRAVEDLPHAHPCGARWAGSLTAHCAACCRTFTGLTAFDRHRPGGVCADPAAVGMTMAPGRAYEAWT
jgi:hypothetical protein